MVLSEDSCRFAIEIHNEVHEFLAKDRAFLIFPTLIPSLSFSVEVIDCNLFPDLQQLLQPPPWE